MKAKVVPRDEALELGARDLEVPTSGLRPESFAFLRACEEHQRAGLNPELRPTPSLPVMIAFYPGGQRAFVDGRHRVLLAREQGKRSIWGVLIGYGPSGGVRWRFEGSFPI